MNNPITRREVELIAMKRGDDGDSCIDTVPFADDVESKADFFCIFIRHTYANPLPESGADWDIVAEHDVETLKEANAILALLDAITEGIA
tara:strand:- start:424 stop:693 length:270 start_codon:yes stop_codon:yes gene_type:complete